MGCSGSKNAEADIPMENRQARPFQTPAEQPYPPRPQHSSQFPLQSIQPVYIREPAQAQQAIRRYQGQVDAPQNRPRFPLGQSEVGPPPAQELWPKKISLGDSGIDVQVWHHSNYENTHFGPFSGWIYLSHGLLKLNQPEIVFRLRQRPNESPSRFPTFPLEWIQVVYEFARMGVHLDEGQMCHIIPGESVRFVVGRREVFRSPDAWRGNTNLRMFVHIFPAYDGVFDIPAGFKIPKRGHHVVGLTAEEAAVALEFGPTRVIAHLGLSVRCFPSPAWIERDREDCCTMADQTNSARSNFKLARIYGVNALLAGGFESGTIILTLPSSEMKKKAIQAAFRNLSQEIVFGLDGFMSEHADSGLMWKSGQKEVRAYTGGTSMDSLNLAYIGFVNHADDQKDGYTLVEDGYCLLLQPNSWEILQQAIASSSDCTIPLDGLTFRLKWLRPAYKSPFNRPMLDKYRSNEPVTISQDESHVRVIGAAFLHEPSPAIISVIALTEYIARIRQLLSELIPPFPPPGIQQPCQAFTVRLQLPTLPGGALATKCDPTDAGVDVYMLSNAIMLVPLEFKDTPPEGHMVYLCHVVFGLWGYTG